MKIRFNISKENGHLLFGILLGAFVLVHSIQAITPTQDQQQQTEQSENDDQKEVTVSQTQALPQVGQISLDFESYLLGEVTFREEKVSEKSVAGLIIPSTRKAIRVLLLKIISPNAP